MFGRDSVLGALTDALDDHGVRGLAIVGEAGVGNTRLAAEVSRVAIQRGRVVEAVIATPALSSIPFGALAHLISVPSDGVDQTQLMAVLMGCSEVVRPTGHHLS